MPIYVARSEAGPVKIGWANNPESRIRALQTAHFARLHVLRLIDAAPSAEKFLHRHYQHLRLNGEWFQFDASMLTIIPPSEPARDTRLADATDDVIKLFGGRSQVAAITGARPNAITQWRYAGIPFKVWPALLTEATKLGVEGITFKTLGETRPPRVAA